MKPAWLKEILLLSLAVVFNGLIFNYPELRLELESRGHRFRSATDTEVIIHAYEEWGVECFDRFNGMFAIAIWDSREQRMVLARDPAGQKPLYYGYRPGHWLLITRCCRTNNPVPAGGSSLVNECRCR